MAVAVRGTSSNYLQRAPSPSGLADVVELILDKGLVIDAYVRVAVIGIELITIDARIVIASVDTYLRFAEAVNRLDLTQTEAAGLKELRGDGDGNGDGKAKGAFEGAKEALSRDRRRDVLAHSNVLTAAVGAGTVLPLRFGTVFQSADAVMRRFLEPRYAELDRLLDELENLVELRVTGFYRREAVLEEIVRDSPRVAQLREAT